jgi:pimeloyl-ACP methyl ester carboxylesterase
MRFVYLHGFASGPQSRKAETFRNAFEERGIHLEIPCLDRDDFEHLTISGQLQVVEECLNGAACRLIGSSMGGYLAALYAASHAEVEKLVLMAPGFGFASRWREMQGPDVISEWRDTGWMEVFHYGSRSLRQVHYGLLEDAANFPGFPDFRQEAMIFHGVKDLVVPIELSREFVASHKNARLREMDSNHELLSVLEAIADEAVPFLL